MKKLFGNKFKIKRMNYKIKLITPPDVVFDQADTLLVICPSADLKKNLQDYLANIEANINVYLYNNDDDNIHWLLAQCKMSDNILIDIDNCNENTNHFLSYILSLPNTYYRVQHMKAPWELLNKNRFYDFPNLEDDNERTN
jgi:hypothetical protein